MHPILKYPGAKWRLAQWIISHFPPHESYLEPFLGSGAVFFNKPKARIETVNDMDGEVVNFFRICRSRPDELAVVLRLTPWSREERSAAFDQDPTGDEIERARRFAVRCWQTFGAGIHKSNGWRHTTAKDSDGGPDNPKLWARLPQCIREASIRLLEAQIENCLAIEAIKRHNGERVLIYADPPYLHNTRTANTKSYRYEMTDADHEELLQALLEHKGMAVISGYDNDLYNGTLRGWHKETINTIAELAAKRTECLWVNPLAYYNKSNQLSIDDM
jgi:DNA adenine methylase